MQADSRWDYVNDELFTISQACAACGLSRSMLIKLEQQGFVTPHKIDPKTGYRYYNMFDISRLQQYQTLRLMNLSTNEVLDYYKGDDARRKEIVSSMKAKLLALTRGIQEMDVRLKRQSGVQYSLMELPDLTCYCTVAAVSQPTDVERVSFEAHAETVRRGWRTMPGESIFTMRIGDDPLASPYTIKLCVPLDPASLGAGSRDGVEVVPGGKMFGVLHYGSYQGRDAFVGAIAGLLEEVRRRGLTQSGPVRGVGIVAPYTGVEFTEKDFVFRFAVPVA